MIGGRFVFFVRTIPQLSSSPCASKCSQYLAPAANFATLIQNMKNTVMMHCVTPDVETWLVWHQCYCFPHRNWNGLESDSDLSDKGLQTSQTNSQECVWDHSLSSRKRWCWSSVTHSPTGWGNGRIKEWAQGIPGYPQINGTFLSVRVPHCSTSWQLSMKYSGLTAFCIRPKAMGFWGRRMDGGGEMFQKLVNRQPCLPLDEL